MAQALTIGSIVLTVGSLAVALALARRRSRVRVGFDVARVVVAVAGILVTAWLVYTSAPIWAIVLAIAGGLGLGFFQGAVLQVSARQGVFYARRSPLAIGLWGVGIILVQVAGLAGRSGAVQVGQSVAWFSAGLGIGLIAGRHRPLQRARQGLAGGTLPVLLALALLPVAIAGVTAPPPALAATQDLSAEELCDLYPQDQGFRFQENPGNQSCFADFGDCDGIEPEPSDCGSGIIKQEASPEDARDNLARHAAPWLQPIAGLGEAAIGGCDTYCNVEFVRGRYWVWWSVDTQLGLERARDLAAQVDARLVALLGGEPPPATTTTSAATTTTVATDEGSTTTTEAAGEGTTTTSAVIAPPPDTEPDEEAITESEAAAQAIAGLIAAAAIGAISWVEAAAGIKRVLGGDEVEGPPPEPPPEAPPPDRPPAEELPPAEPVVDQPPAEEPAATEPRPDPCAFQQANYEGALGEWRRIQSEIDALRSEYRALELQIETERVRDHAGAWIDLGLMGLDLAGLEPPSPGVFKAMVEAAKQGFAQSIIKQLIQSAAAGEMPNPAAILSEASLSATGIGDLMADKLPGGAFGEFFTQSITSLLAANEAYDYLKFMETLATPGAIADPGVIRALEQSAYESYFERVGPWVSVVSKAIDLWDKNKEWGEGVERRNGMRDELTRLATRIGELEYGLGEATDACNTYRGFLSRCREEMG